MPVEIVGPDIRGVGPIAPQDKLIILSHDCDVTHASIEHEPYVEIGIARAIDVGIPDGNLTHGKNPRRLQLVLDGGVFEVSMKERCFVGRGLLRVPDPRAPARLDEETCRLLARWLGRRYDRAAFPNELNRRMALAQRTVRQVLQRQGTNLTSLYIQGAEGELEPEHAYELVLWGTMLADHYGDIERRTEAQNGLDQVAEAIGRCDNILVVDTLLRSEAEVTLDDLRLIRRWDFDYLSEREDSLGTTAPRD